MAAVMGYLLIVSALIAPGLTLSCVKCMNYNGGPCTGETETCTAGSSCITAVSLTTIGAKIQNSSLARGCYPTNLCNLTGSLTFQYGKLKISTSCCNSDNCSPTSPVLPSDSTTLNGESCGTCASANSVYCITDKTLQCYGEESKCGILSTYTAGSVQVSEAIRGCATPSVCDLLGNVQATYGNLHTTVTTFCSGCTHLQGTFYLYTVIMLVLVKVLL